MIQFILNNKEVQINLLAGLPLLDYIRYHKHLTGTKVGCREGDCGACAVLVGELKEGEVAYRSITSCLAPLGNVQNKHVVTIEGLNMDDLNPIQLAIQNVSATQCGFCTPGFVVSLAGFCLSKKEATAENAIAAIDGNICRCTGYKSIERAAGEVAKCVMGKQKEDPLQYVAEQKILPFYFAGIKERLQKLSKSSNGQQEKGALHFVGGGTDLYVQQHDRMKDASISFMTQQPSLKNIYRAGNRCIIGGAATVADLSESEIFQQYFPQLRRYIKLVSSTPIRNMATVAGNIINASPIGDLTIFLLALDARLLLSDGLSKRELHLKNLYKGYKTLNKKEEEFIEEIWFELPAAANFFHFEKVSKRTHLDIASVNTAIRITVQNEVIKEACLSAGGVAPIPLFLSQTAAYLKGKTATEEVVMDAIKLAQTEISPISDTRGTERYKRLLFAQLIKAHFITLFPRLNAVVLIQV